MVQNHIFLATASILALIGVCAALMPFMADRLSTLGKLRLEQNKRAEKTA